MTDDDPLADGPQVFISYSRRDLAAADTLASELEAQGVEVLIDRRDLPYGEEWQAELAELIRMSDTVVWLVSPDSVGSKWVNWELGELKRLSKRLIPIHIRETDPACFPEALGKIHLLPSDALFNIHEHLKLLVNTLNTDLAWLKDATRLADRARQWMLKDRDRGLLLYGRALVDAEAWTQSKPQVAPPIASEILDLLLNSRRATIRRQRQFVAAALAVAIVGFGLALLSWQQRNAALANQSTFLAKLSQDSLGAGDVGTSLLLAMSALPQWRFQLDRPFVSEAGRSLYNAILAIREATAFVGHTGDVNSVRYTSDDQTILTSSDDGTARLWNAKTGALVRTLEPHNDKVFTAQFDPDDHFIATLTTDYDIHIWGAEDGRPRYTLKGHTDRVSSVEFAKIPDRLISASRDATARIWHLGNLADVAVLRGHHATVTSATFSPDAKRALTSSADNSAIVWDVESTRPVRHLIGHKAPVLGAIFDGTGTKVATYSQDQAARVWDVTSDKAFPFLRHGSPINSIAFCSRTDCLITAGADGVARLWNFRDGTLVAELKGHSQPILKAVVSPDGTLAATVSRDGLALVWEVETGSRLLTLGGHTGDIFDVAFAHDGEFLVTASRDRTARSWRVPAPTTTASRVNLKTAFRSIDLSRDGKLAALGAEDGSVHLLDGNSLKELAATNIGDGAVTLVAFDRLGGRLLTGSAKGSIRVFLVPSLVQISAASTDGSEIGGGGFDQAGLGYSVATVAGARFVSNGKDLHADPNDFGAKNQDVLVTTLSPALDKVLIGKMNGAASIVDAGTGKQLVELKGHVGTILQGAFDATGQRVITSSEDGTARIWNATTGETVQVLTNRESPATFADLTDDGKYAATAYRDGSVRLWRLGVDTPIAVYTGHLAGVDLVRVLPDKSSFISAAHDGEVHLWSFVDQYSPMLQRARASAPRCLSQAQLDKFGLTLSLPKWCNGAGFAANSGVFRVPASEAKK